MPEPVNLFTNIRWNVQRKWVYRKWSVTTVSGSTTDVIGGWACTKRGAMRQAEQVIRIYTMMAKAIASTVVPT